MTATIKPEPKLVTPRVTVTPHNHVCMYGPCTNIAKPEKTIRVGSTHYHYCGMHP